MFSTFKPPLRCGNDRDVENQRFPPSLWKTLRVYHIPTTAPYSTYSCVNVYADSLRKRMRLLTGDAIAWDRLSGMARRKRHHALQIRRRVRIPVVAPAVLPRLSPHHGGRGRRSGDIRFHRAEHGGRLQAGLYDVDSGYSKAADILKSALLPPFSSSGLLVE